MNIPDLYPVIMCGGSGTRLWPLSRASYPKQFGRILGQTSLFQKTVSRLKETDCARPIVVTGGDFRFIVTEQLAAIGRAASSILIEPDARNTAPAVLAAAVRLEQTAPDGLMLVCPSDHAIESADLYLAAIEAGVPAARNGSIVTFGIEPTRPATGYGYLELDTAPVPGAPQPVPLRRFVEKPSEDVAKAMLADGNYLWNGGIFLFSVATILAAYERHQPEMTDAVRAAVQNAESDLAFLRLDAAAWAGAPSISIDYAIMEKTDALAVVPLQSGWSDLGAWDEIAREMGPDDHGVATLGDAYAIGCRDTLLRAESGDQVLVGVGLNNVVAVAMHDAVLVADLSDSQRVKEAVTLLKEKGASQATDFLRFHRPWGWYETLSLGDRFQVKRIMVHPGGILSLQSHVHRAEHWVVVEGTARVTVGEEVRLLCENESVYIPLGAVHRLENPGKVDLHLIEVQSGTYLGEDDIVRYEDIYARA
ncbi:MAG: mannose-1-phosphate guanylyltransferase/mannose-6-phosphate isomerase [Pseudomonadota bacterium]